MAAGAQVNGRISHAPEETAVARELPAPTALEEAVPA
jgi:hypothetical protein